MNRMEKYCRVLDINEDGEWSIQYKKVLDDCKYEEIFLEKILNNESIPLL